MDPCMEIREVRKLKDAIARCRHPGSSNNRHKHHLRIYRKCLDKTVSVLFPERVWPWQEGNS